MQELTETRHKLNEVQQQLQEGSAQAAQQEQQHKQAVARLTQDLQQEQQARSGFAEPPSACIIIIMGYDVTSVKLTVVRRWSALPVISSICTILFKPIHMIGLAHL